MAEIYKSIKERKDMSGGTLVSTDNAKNVLISVSKDVSGAVIQVESTEQLLSTKLDPTGHQEPLTFARRYPSLTMNPLRAKLVSAGQDNIKAFNYPARLGINESVGLRKIGAQYKSIPKEACDLSKDFTIGSFQKINAVRTGDATYIISKSSGLFLYMNSSYSLFVRATLSDGVTMANPVDVTPTFSIFGKNCFYVEKKTGLLLEVFVNNILIKQVTLTENIGNNTNAFADLNGGTTDLTDQYDIFLNYSASASEMNILYNNGRPDLANIPEYMKWVNNVELITNGTFETDTTGWLGQTNHSIERITSDYHSGTACLQITSSGVGTSTGARVIYSLGVTAIKYRYGFWAKSISGNTTLNVMGGLGDNNNTLQVFTIGSSWAFYSFSDLLKISASYAITFYLSGAGVLLIDDVSMVRAGITALFEPKGINVPTSLSSTSTATVTAGTAYEIVTTDFTTQEVTDTGAPSGLVGTRFVATGNKTLASTKVKPICSDLWYDSSTNGLNATVVGKPTVELVIVEEKQGDGIISMSEQLVTNKTEVTNTTDSNAIASIGKGKLLFADRSNYRMLNMDIRKFRNPMYAEFINTNINAQNLTTAYSSKFKIGSGSFAIAISGYLSFPSILDGSLAFGTTDTTRGSFGLISSPATGGLTNTYRAYVSDSNSTQNAKASTILVMDSSKMTQIVAVLDRTNNMLKICEGGILRTSIALQAGFGSVDALSDFVINSQYIRGKILRYQMMNFDPSTTVINGSTVLSQLWNNGSPHTAIIHNSLKLGSNASPISIGDLANSAEAPYQYATFTASGANITSAIKSSALGIATSSLVSVISGKKYNVNYTLTLNNGKTVLPSLGLQASTAGTSASDSVESMIALKSGNNSLTLTANATKSTRLTVATSGDVDFSLNITSVTAAGIIADYNSSGFVTNTSGQITSLTDESANALTATVAGTPQVVFEPYTDINGLNNILSTFNNTQTKLVNVTTSLECGILPAGWAIIRILATSTSAITGLTLGTTGAGTDILTATNISGAGEWVVINTGNPFSSTLTKTIYSNASNLNSGTVTLRFVMVKVV